MNREPAVMVWVYYLLLLLISVAGLFLTILGLPGLWLMVGAHAIFMAVTGVNVHVGWPSVVTLLVLGLLAEILEFAAGAAGSKAAGGRKRGMFGAIVGALVGGLVISFLLPIPIVGTIVGACFGAFVGAALMELTDREFMHAMRVGLGAAKGRLWGIVIKLLIGATMLVIIIIAAIPL